MVPGQRPSQPSTDSLQPSLLAFYRGISLGSRIIRWVNWSDYSHVAWQDGHSGEVIEAWTSGVRRVASLHDQHTPGTVVDLFEVTGLTPEDASRIWAFLNEAVGKRYDFLGCLHFATRRPEYAWQQNRWFCSELVFAACRAAGVNLLCRVPAWKVYPGMLATSPLLSLRETVTVNDPTEPDQAPTAAPQLFDV